MLSREGDEVARLNLDNGKLAAKLEDAQHQIDELESRLRLAKAEADVAVRGFIKALLYSFDGAGLFDSALMRRRLKHRRSKRRTLTIAPLSNSH